MGVKLYWDVLMDVEIRIKEKRVRFDINIVSMKKNKEFRKNISDFEYFSWTNAWSFFRKNKQPRKTTQSSREDIENIANDIVNSVSGAILGKVDTKASDW